MLTRSSSAPSLHEATARIRVLELDICEYGVVERTEMGYGDMAVRVDVALMLGAAVGVVALVYGTTMVELTAVVVVDLTALSEREVDVAVEVDPRVSLPCVA